MSILSNNYPRKYWEVHLKDGTKKQLKSQSSFTRYTKQNRKKIAATTIVTIVGPPEYILGDYDEL
jgi:hypothetical protein